MRAMRNLSVLAIMVGAFFTLAGNALASPDATSRVNCRLGDSHTWSRLGGDPVWAGGVSNAAQLSVVVKAAAGQRSLVCLGLNQVERKMVTSKIGTAKSCTMKWGQKFIVMAFGSDGASVDRPTRFVDNRFKAGARAFCLTVKVKGGKTTTTIKLLWPEICVNAALISQKTTKTPPAKNKATKPKPKPKPAPPCNCAPAPKPTPKKSTKIFGSKKAIVDGTRKAGIQFYLQLSQGAKRYPVVPVTSGVAPKFIGSLQRNKAARACEVNVGHSLDGWTLAFRCVKFVPTGAKYTLKPFLNTKTTPPVAAPKPTPTPAPAAVCILNGVPQYTQPAGYIIGPNGVCVAVAVSVPTVNCESNQTPVTNSQGVVINCITNTNVNTNTNTATTGPVTVVVNPVVTPPPAVVVTPPAVTLSPACSAVLTADKSNRVVSLTAGGTASNGSTPTGAGWTLSKNAAVVGTASGLSTTFTFADQLTTYNWTAVVQWSSGSATCSGSIQTGAAPPPLPGG